MSQPAREYLAARVSGDHLEEVVKQLQDPDFGTPEEFLNPIILMAGRLSALQQGIAAHTLSTEEAQLERSRIRSGLLELVTQLPETLLVTTAQEQEEKKRRYRWVISLFVYLAIAGGAVFWAFQPQQNLRTEGTLSVNRLSFKYLSGNLGLNGLKVEQLTINPYRKFSLSPAKIWLDRDLLTIGTWDDSLTEVAAPLVLTPYDDMLGVGINLYASPRIEAVNGLQDSAWVTLSQPDETEHSRFHLTIEQEGAIHGLLSNSDSLYLEPELVSVQGWPGEEVWDAPVRLMMWKPMVAGEAEFEGVPGIFGMDFLITQHLFFQCKELEVLNPTFLKKDGNQPASTLLGGDLQIKEADRDPLLAISLAPNEQLHLSSDQPISIREINLTAENITVHFVAYLDRIETREGGFYKVRNPSRLEWLWYAQRLLLIFAGLVLFGAIFFLPGPIKEQTMNFVKHMKAVPK